jgi:hypothetical protein
MDKEYGIEMHQWKNLLIYLGSLYVLVIEHANWAAKIFMSDIC